MTFVNPNAAICGECRPLVEAYRKGQRVQWEQDFTDLYGREPTEHERLHGQPGAFALGPEGWPDCERCHGVGAYMGDGSTAVLSRTIMPRTKITQAPENEAEHLTCSGCGRPVGYFHEESCPRRRAMGRTATIADYAGVMR